MLALAPDEGLPWSVAERPQGGEWKSMVARGPDRPRREQMLTEAAEPSTHWCRNQVITLIVALIYS